jgi:hypothetical protein
MTATPRSRAQRLITAIRDRAFAELERQQGDLAPMALTMDAAGRIGMVAVYTGDTFPSPDNHLADLTATVKRQVATHALESAATAHYERVVLAGGTAAVDAVCVQYETRRAGPLRIYFPYQIKKKLSGRSEISHLPAVTKAGKHVVFADRAAEDPAEAERS